MNGYLLDTDILSQLMKINRNLSVIRRLSALSKTQQFSSSVTMAELYFGAYRGPQPVAYFKAIRERILPNIQILLFDLKAAQNYGALRARLERRGRPLSQADMMIAAIALANDMVLATGNIRHFGRISELKVEDWFS